MQDVNVPTKQSRFPHLELAAEDRSRPVLFIIHTRTYLARKLPTLNMPFLSALHKTIFSIERLAAEKTWMILLSIVDISVAYSMLLSLEAT